MKQTIELTDEEKVARVYEAIGAASACWDNLRGAGVFESTRAKEIAEELCRDLGLTIPAEPAPERTEYPLQRITESQFNGRISIHDFDEVLVAAHSLRPGDRIEWAPGDWREIAKVELNDPEYAIYTFHVGDQRATYRGWDLLPVRR